MSRTITYHSFDDKQVIMVPVIASFDTDGNILPLYVRIRGNSLKVQSSHIHHVSPNIIEFHCRVIDYNRLKPLALSYYQSEKIWGIPSSYDIT
ncbi:MAG: hypothetical protein SPI87_01430 [Anaerobutyricum sp.]|nr:hypothetical protein [Eubacterium sp.]MDY6045676.1 hypothetical protein [Anaerobutyricum sp.]